MSSTPSAAPSCALRAATISSPHAPPSWSPAHSAYGIGLARFDLDRLGFDEGEEILPGITIHADSGVTGNFRVLCDGDHEENLEREAEEADMGEAVAAGRQISITPGGGQERFTS